MSGRSITNGCWMFAASASAEAAYLEGLSLCDLDRRVLDAPRIEAQKRFANVIDTQRIMEEHHKQLLRDGFFRDKKRFEEEKEGK